MKVNIKEWNAVATWRWDMPDDEVCGICRVQFDGTCPTCKFPGDDCSLLLGKCGHSFHMPTQLEMSLPKHTTSPSLSSSPSRQSIRRPANSNAPSRPQSIIDRPPTAQQTHHPLESTTTHDPPLDNPPSQTHQGDGHHDFPPQHHQPPPFQPFFTLIEDANTSEYYHPTVHYIFSDDDTDIVTEAALRSLENDQDVLSQGPKGKSKPVRAKDGAGDGEVYDEEDDEFAIARKDPLLLPPIPGVRDNYIILDLETTASDETVHPGNVAAASNRENITGASSSLPSQTQTHLAGAQSQQQQQTQHPNTPNPQTQTPDHKGPQPPQFSVSSVHSLTPSWQVLHTQVIPAPTFEKNTSNEPVNGGLMLKIQGTAGLPITLLGKDRDKERSSQRLEEMMDQFSKRLGELRQVVEAGEQGQFGEERGGEEGVEEQEPNDATAVVGFGNDNALGVHLEGEGGAEVGNGEDGMENEG
ncbi:uncharacterized protein KD926_005858 [Aspergillus affinis]|uniref:uncharacterized protein n=1 Tax=Aspergillus affinis TaxID=1070780 RepID=UPI0022FDF43D|nr:uncharacterized protein KD926_005858 [Aspergillus affinis]KAI9045915.1 hypothetical protein KD926_005858 [Aspergillus affinis]